MSGSQEQRRIWIGLPEETDRRLADLTDYVLTGNGDGLAWRKMRQALAAAAFERGLAGIETDHGLGAPPAPETEAGDLPALP